MNITDYYINEFRNDLGYFMPDPQLPYFGNGWDYECENLEKIPTERRAVFLICLYFTVLVDQAMHTHYSSHYARFEELTKYPKFCHGLGQFQKNPRSIISVPVDKGLVEHSAIEKHLQDGMDLFVDEVDTFFKEHIPSIKAAEFFEKLIYDPDVQIPELLAQIAAVRNHIDYKSYKAMWNAVEKKYPRNN